MKKSFYFIFILFALLLNLSCALNSSGDSDSRAESDWLCLFYFDADDIPLNDDIYTNMRELECALAFMRNEDGSPAVNEQDEEYPSVRFIVLWDGYKDTADGKVTRLHPDGAVFELGADYELKKQYKETERLEPKPEGFCISKNTKDLTSTLGWLEKEPDMASETTLTKFLSWANRTYKAKNTILVLSDHGAGVWKETYRDDLSSSRSLCCDESNVVGSKRYGADLTCKNVTNALTDSGYTGSSKINLLCFDVCLESSCEIVNCLSGYADYFVASPANAYSHDYTYLFKYMNSAYKPIDLGRNFVCEYCRSWGGDPVDCPKTESEAHWASGCSMYTQTLFSLSPSKVKALKNAVDALADGLMHMSEADNQAIFTNYLYQNKADYNACKGIAYQGTYVFLNDLGFFVKNILENTANINMSNYEELTDAATNLQELLAHGDDKLIVYAYAGRKAGKVNSNHTWGDVTTGQWYLSYGTDFISGETVNVVNPNPYFGITIATQNVDDDYNVVDYYDNFTGFSEKWENVIRYWKSVLNNTN